MADMVQDPTQTPETPADAPVIEPAPAPIEPAANTVNIPVEQLEPYGGKDWHKAVQYAKAGKQIVESGYASTIETLQNAGITPDQFSEWWNSNQQEEPELQAPAHDINAVVQQAINQSLPETLNVVLAQRDQQYATQRAWDAENQFKSAAIKETIGSEEFSPVAQVMFDKILDDAVASELPITATAEQKAAVGSTPASRSALAKAKEQFEAQWADFRNSIVSQAAETQKKIPNGTLDGGHGGSAPQKPFDQMTKAERAEYMTGLLGISDD